MAIVSAVTRAALRTTTGTQDFTVTGFGTPKCAIFFVTSAVTDATEAAGLNWSMGATDGTNQWTVCCRADDNNATADTDRRAAADGIPRNVHRALRQ